MIMAPEREDLILSELRLLRTDVRLDISQLHAKVDNFANNGCAHKPAHDRVRDDVESRVRQLEKYQQRQVGALTAAGGAGGLISAMLVWLGRVMLSKIGNGG